VPTIEQAHGIKFLCPKCWRKNGGPKGTHSIRVFFHGRPVPPHLGLNSQGQPVRWIVSGTDYHNLSLSPSILLNHGCRWHGFVTNGDVSILPS
jgi:hypothetical protein